MTGLGWVWWNWNIIGDLRLMLQFEFIRNAFEAGTIIAILSGIVSYLVVLRRSSFAAHALGHAGFSGAAGAVLFGVAPIYGLLAATMSSGLGVSLLGQKAAHRDVEIGTVLAFMLGLGLLFLSFYQGFATEAYSILFGEIVGISDAQVLFTLEMSLVVLAVLGLVYRPLLFASLDEEVAEAKGMHTLLLGLIFMLALAVAISVAVTVIGVLLIFALTVTPAAIGTRLAKRPLFAVLISVSMALLATWAGIFIAFCEVEPMSFFIVTIIFSIYLIVRAAPVVSSRVGRGSLPTDRSGPNRPEPSLPPLPDFVEPHPPRVRDALPKDPDPGS
jgi:zinc/manganese transport system permease protein